MSELPPEETQPTPSDLVDVARQLLEGQPQKPGSAYREVRHNPSFWKFEFRALLHLPVVPLIGPDYEEAEPSTKLDPFYVPNEHERQIYYALGHSVYRIVTTDIGWETYALSGHTPAQLVDGKVEPKPGVKEALYIISTTATDSEGRNRFVTCHQVFNEEGIIMEKNYIPELPSINRLSIVEDSLRTDPDKLAIAHTLMGRMLQNATNS